jgi:hypothetical protein
MCTIYLTLQLRHPGAPAPDMGQLIGLRRLTVHRGLGTIARRQHPILRGLGTFLGRSGALIRRPGAIVRGTGTVILRPLTVSRRPPKHPLLAFIRFGWLHRTIPRPGAGVPRLGYLIARLRHIVTLVRCDLARPRGSQTGPRLSVSEMRRVRTMHTAHVTNPLIGLHRGFLVAGSLILVRRALVAV